MLKRTPLFETHRGLGAKLVDFGGWEMPVQYTSIVEEHNAVRSAAGIFDISHMGEFVAGGAAAEAFLNRALTNDVRKIEPGKGQYTLMCNQQGGTVDDLYLYCLARGNYLLIVNASRISPDFEWLRSVLNAFGNPNTVFLEDKSASYGAVALQGPKAVCFIDEALKSSGSSDGPSLGTLQKNEIRAFSFRGELIHVARTGYTGEDGFEILAPAPLIEKVWASCMEAGRSYGIKPCGLGARDTLRTEACYPLYGHELNETTTPIEAGLGYFVSLDKGEFMGRTTLSAQKADGSRRKLAAFVMEGKTPPPRPDYAIYSADGSTALGQVSSGTQSPTIGAGIGLGYIPAEHAAPGTKIQIEIRGNRFPAQIVKKPFYKRVPSQ
jgi:aminomethyltransferase